MALADLPKTVDRDFDLALDEFDAAVGDDAPQSADHRHRRFARLLPAERLLADRIRCEVFPLRRRVARGSNLLILLRVPSADWLLSAVPAAEAAMADLAARAGCEERRCGRVIFEPSSRRKSIDVDEVRGHLLSGHCILSMPQGCKMPPVLAALADLDMTISPFAVDEVTRALRRSYAGSRIRLGHEAGLSALTPVDLNLACRKSGRPREAIGLLAKLAGSSATSGDSSVPAFEKLEGYGDAKAWGLQMIADNAAYRRGEIAGSDIGPGALLVGPPGTGKTLFANSLAKAAGTAFFPASYSAWQGQREGHLGDVTKSIQRTFSDARAASPAIVFLDELDAIPARNAGARHDDWWGAIVATLLEELDGTDRRQGVVVVGACNDDRGLDRALVRAGRLDRIIRIDLPDEAALTKILAHHLPNLPLDQLEPIAITHAGTMSGADVARLARDARARARSRGRAMEPSDVLATALPVDERPESLRRRIAIHEAGHAVVGMVQGAVPRSVSIVGDHSSGGRVITPAVGGEGVLPDIEKTVIRTLAGRAAEEIILGNVSAGASNDLERATTLVAQVEAYLGLGSHLAAVTGAEHAPTERRLRRLYGEAAILILTHKSDVVALADRLMKERVMGQQALKDFACERCWQTLTIQPVERPPD
ncbi:AAA family ATPase [Consotaella salsifontis]|uniref:ATP-dependent Zn proteases n=1 Tax=Consotaella salsifontis TaxID=1365950 RepID=A0A1T4S2S5_9HYPH|nr:AAA family ATPase [Consotaella salsifontis]SKA22248.1 ATP-dependent Zn proteases [Consotaella salsifontis]